MPDELHVVVVGGGFAGVGCARRLAGHDDVHVTLIDRNNYHQFQPLLYQVATSQLASSDDRLLAAQAVPRRPQRRREAGGGARRSTRRRGRVTTTDGRALGGDALVLAAGSQPNFFGTPGAEEHAFPLYSLDDAAAPALAHPRRLRGRRPRPPLIDAGALNFVVVGGGPTGVEIGRRARRPDRARR